MTKKDPDVKFMKLAIQAAALGIRRKQTPFGACIVKDNNVISLAHNVVFKTTDITAHAEISAIRLACKKLRSVDLSGCVIYSTCEPCPMCFAACHWAKISRIVYGLSIADAQKAGFNELTVSNGQMKKIGNSPIRIRAGLLRRENLRIFQLWEKSAKKRAY